ncbi:hypothetical protein ON010_g8000 [Phytophthora cinnamomi]|nr:hypothetical protein ON010_g8000 [Phytophthora cinnamomi]
MTKAIKDAARAAGEDLDKYSKHSMCSRGATALLTSGVDRIAIKRFGRWRSDAHEWYTRIDGQTIYDLAQNMVRGLNSTPNNL